MVQDIALKDTPANGQETVVAWVDPSAFLPEPTRIIEKAAASRARNVIVVGRNPVPCDNLEIPAQLDSPISPVSLWISQCQKKGFPSVVIEFDDNGIVAIVAGTRKKTVPGISDKNATFHLLTDISQDVSDKILMAPHTGWACEGDALAVSGLAAIYVVNRTNELLSLQMEFEVQTEDPDALLQLHLDLCYVQRFSLARGERSLLRVEDVIVTPGGHGIQVLSQTGAPIRILKMRVDGQPYPAGKFLFSLPCDQYQRHSAVADAVESLAAQNATILDVGGGRGMLSLFLPKHQVTTLDARPYDVPGHVHNTRESLPFADNAFDMVVSVDVLEHIPESSREPFIRELWRVAKRAVVLACPFNDEHVAFAERCLADFAVRVRGQENAFLSEHIQNGLPEFGQTSQVFEALGAKTVSIPNGFLPRWFSMMVLRSMLETNLDYYARLHCILNAYNRGYYDIDHAEPCYRRLIIACKEPNDKQTAQDLATRLVARNPSGNPALTDPERALRFYNIPISAAFEEWYRRCQEKIARWSRLPS